MDLLADNNHYRLKFLTFILIVASGISGFAQSREKSFDRFLKFAGGNVKITDDLKKDCRWTYALVLVDCDNNSKIIKCRILNDVPSYLQRSFDFLVGYSFRKSQPVAKKSLIFCVTFENHNTDCILNNKALPTEAVRDVFQRIGQQLYKKPNTIILYQTQNVFYNGDRIE